MKTGIIVAVLVIVGLVLITQSLFSVDETELVIVTRFGEVRSVKTRPGLNVKVPFVDSTTTFDKRVLRIDAPSERMLDKDSNVLEVDVYSRYRITDAVQFRKTLRSEESARSVLSNRINTALRAIVAERDREQIIGGTLVRDPLGNPVVDPAGNPEVIPTNSRTELLNEVLAKVKRELTAAKEPFGIEMIDVRIKRADFPAEVAERVFERMRTDRQKIAQDLRSKGSEESLKIRAEAERQKEVTLADADKQANILRGEGEAEAIRVLADSLGQDPEFFAFRRSLQAYRAFLNEQTAVLLPANSDLFRFLQSPGTGSGSTTE